MISATVSGTVGKDAELKRVGDGEVLEFSVASNRFEKGEKKTDWVRVTVWGKRAAQLEKIVKKGGRVAVRGALHGRAYAGKDGAACSLEMRADDVDLLGGGDRQEAAPAPRRQASMLDAFADRGGDDSIPF
jgi:single-strand DNA-binding protein